ncbi:Mu transposase C-terminal domain-containing protein [uncultured Microbacterium sp.]|uniref:Mu transposase C-terminal domain-containing protein n=1 Tax=uncultured Microbacterium sp. TaxID=191216 RepID=UPI00263967F0|nr:Mu transposase C-terminal domain-containing protein [uncultured Microbacterium sp.]
MNVVRLWDWIVFDGRSCQVVALEGAIVEVEDAQTLERNKIPVGDVVSHATVQEQRSSLGEVAVLARLTASERERCERIAAGLRRMDAESLGGPGMIVDRAREHLAEVGVHVSGRQAERYLAAFRVFGVTGLIDRRRHPARRRSTIDPKIYDLLESELADQRDASTGTRSRAITRVTWKAEQASVSVPSRATMYRLLAELDRGRSSFGPATTRRSKALRPDRTFRGMPVTRPGELVEIDSTPMDVVALRADGSRCRPELTYAIDVATSTICATLIREGATKSVDVGAVLLSRILTPLKKRPGWASTREHAGTLFGPGFLPTDDEWDELAGTMPLIVPEAVTVDRGKVFIGSTFTAACERREISQIIANPRQPTDKPHVEGGFRRIRDGFVQYLAGFSGGSVADRGANPESEAVWTVDELQILLDLWVLTTWQTKPQSGLRLPDIPRRTLSPNQMYQALSVAAPQVPVGLSEADYIALMPMEWRTIQPYGINLHSLTYDSEMLHPFRGRTSGLSGAARGRWEVRYDPYNLRQIWVRDHHADRWITANWTLSTMTDQPLSREVLHAARANLASDDVRAASSIDLLKEVSRLQDERARTRKQSARAKRTPPEPVLRLVDDPVVSDSTSSVAQVPISERLRILE